MAQDGLTGNRIRERRMMQGIRQAELAKQVGISASYLNLIEHNRRRIAGKLLLEVSKALEIDTAALTEGAEAAVLAGLKEADAAVPDSGAELDRTEEFVGRFPGWANLITAQNKRIFDLERTLEAFGDRLAHDPVLAESVHEVLSTAASIRSTASILADTDTLEPKWLERFHGNINQDSARLAESSRALAKYLETDDTQNHGAQLPQEEVDAFLERHNFHFAALEDSRGDVEDVLAQEDFSALGRVHAKAILTQYQQDARDLPIALLREKIKLEQGRVDPIYLARLLEAPVALVLRRVACVPEVSSGFVLCDRSGSLLLRKSLAGFGFPRFGASCPLWPVFQAIGQSGVVVQQRLTQLGRREMQFDSYAIADPIATPVYNQAPLVRSAMLILPVTPGDRVDQAETLKVGSSCRVCPRDACPARREPSILTAG